MDGLSCTRGVIWAYLCKVFGAFFIGLLVGEALDECRISR